MPFCDGTRVLYLLWCRDLLQWWVMSFIPYLSEDCEGSFEEETTCTVCWPRLLNKEVASFDPLRDISNLKVPALEKAIRLFFFKATPPGFQGMMWRSSGQGVLWKSCRLALWKRRRWSWEALWKPVWARSRCRS